MCQRDKCAVVVVVVHANAKQMSREGQVFLKLRREAKLTHSIPEIILSY